MKGRHIFFVFLPPNIFSTSPTHSVPAFEIAASILPAFIFIAFWLFFFFLDRFSSSRFSPKIHLKYVFFLFSFSFFPNFCLGFGSCTFRIFCCAYGMGLLLGQVRPVRRKCQQRAERPRWATPSIAIQNPAAYLRVWVLWLFWGCFAAYIYQILHRVGMRTNYT